jgi:hypothetical protein
MWQRFLKWCGFHVHDWGAWVETGEIVRRSDKGVIGTVQSRTCTTCNKRQVDKIWLG